MAVAHAATEALTEHCTQMTQLWDNGNEQTMHWAQSSEQQLQAARSKQQQLEAKVTAIAAQHAAKVAALAATIATSFASDADAWVAWLERKFVRSVQAWTRTVRPNHSPTRRPADPPAQRL